MDLIAIALFFVLMPITIGTAFLVSLFKITDYVQNNDHSEYLDSLEDK
jgi:hypothetical protein